jgi:hypothetical protein
MSTAIAVRLVQLKNTSIPMLVTLAGTAILVSLVQL